MAEKLEEAGLKAGPGFLHSVPKATMGFLRQFIAQPKSNCVHRARGKPLQKRKGQGGKGTGSHRSAREASQESRPPAVSHPRTQ